MPGGVLSYIRSARNKDASSSFAADATLKTELHIKYSGLHMQGGNTWHHVAEWLMMVSKEESNFGKNERRGVKLKLL